MQMRVGERAMCGVHVWGERAACTAGLKGACVGSGIMSIRQGRLDSDTETEVEREKVEQGDTASTLPQ